MSSLLMGRRSGRNSGRARSSWVLFLALALSLPATAFELQAHRGGAGLRPENTLPAFAHALSLGVDALEMDLAVSADGVLLISHDLRLNPEFTRGPDGQYLGTRPPIRSLSAAELARYDVGVAPQGSTYATRRPDLQPVPGARLPRLAEVFELLKRSGNTHLRLAIETKISPLEPELTLQPEALARALIKAIRAAGLAERCDVLSFDWRTLAVLRREAPEIGAVYLSVQQRNFDNIGSAEAPSPWTAGWRIAEHGSVPKLIRAAAGTGSGSGAASGRVLWSAYFGDLSADKVREAQALGLKVLAWTVNRPDDMQRLLDWGVDGIVTDRPDLLRAVLAQRGWPLPAPTPVAP